jgi:glycosyltransferase involved in cell wall biosynthesis
MARAVTAEGFVATLVATRAYDHTLPDPTPINFGGLRGLLFRRNRLSRYSYSRSLSHWLKRHVSEYDLVEIHGIFNYPCLAAGRAARAASVPYVVHPHGQLDPFDLRKHRILKHFVGRLFIRPLLAGARIALTASQLESDRLQSYGASVHVETLPLPYLVSDAGADGDAFRMKYELQDALVVLFLGRVNYKKGLTYVVDALSTVVAMFPQTKLVLGGDDQSAYATELKEQVQRAKLSQHVRFLGTLSDSEKASALAVAAILVLVSDNENYGLVLVEAAWWGVPMLISDEVYIASLLEEAGAALVVKRRSAAVADGLMKLLGDAELRRSMGTGGRQLAGTVLSWDACAAEHGDLRRRLLREPASLAHSSIRTTGQ